MKSLLRVRSAVIIVFISLMLTHQSAASDPLVALDEARRLSRTGNYTEAVKLLEREVLARSANPTPEIRIAAFEILGVTREITGKHQEAADAFLMRWIELVAAHGSDELVSIREAARVATALTRSGRYEQSRAFWRVHLAAANRADLEDFIKKGDASFGIARSYDEEGVASSAEDWYQISLNEVRADGLQRAVILSAYANLLEKLQRSGEAETLRQQADAIRASEAN